MPQIAVETLRASIPSPLYHSISLFNPKLFFVCFSRPSCCAHTLPSIVNFIPAFLNLIMSFFFFVIFLASKDLIYSKENKILNGKYRTCVTAAITDCWFVYTDRHFVFLLFIFDSWTIRIFQHGHRLLISFLTFLLERLFIRRPPFSIVHKQKKKKHKLEENSIFNSREVVGD